MFFKHMKCTLLNDSCISQSTCIWVGWVIGVGIVTCYGLDGPGIKSHLGVTFLHSSSWSWGLLYNGYWVISKGNAAGAWH